MFFRALTHFFIYVNNFFHKLNEKYSPYIYSYFIKSSIKFTIVLYHRLSWRTTIFLQTFAWFYENSQENSELHRMQSSRTRRMIMLQEFYSAGTIFYKWKNKYQGAVRNSKMKLYISWNENKETNLVSNISGMIKLN